MYTAIVDRPGLPHCTTTPSLREPPYSKASIARRLNPTAD
jgi:hypothetical protein